MTASVLPFSAHDQEDADGTDGMTSQHDPEDGGIAFCRIIDQAVDRRGEGIQCGAAQGDLRIGR